MACWNESPRGMVVLLTETEYHARHWGACVVGGGYVTVGLPAETRCRSGRELPTWRLRMVT